MIYWRQKAGKSVYFLDYIICRWCRSVHYLPVILYMTSADRVQTRVYFYCCRSQSVWECCVCWLTGSLHGSVEWFHITAQEMLCCAQMHFSRDMPRIIFKNTTKSKHISSSCARPLVMQIETLISSHFLADISALVCRNAPVRVTACELSGFCFFFFFPKAFAVLLRVVDPLQDFQPVWPSVRTPCRQAVQVGILGWREGNVLPPPPLLQTQLHTTPCTPPSGHSCQRFLTCEHGTLSVSFALPLCFHRQFAAHQPKTRWEN